jgi:hypothetical protein
MTLLPLRWKFRVQPAIIRLTGLSLLFVIATKFVYILRFRAAKVKVSQRIAFHRQS